MPSPRILPLPDAARELGVRPDTVRNWIRLGCPCVRQGRNGPGGAALVDIERVRVWRARGAEFAPLVRVDQDILARGLAAAYRACSDIGVTSRQKAALLVIAYDAIVRAITNHPAQEPPPAEITMLIAIALGSRKVQP